MGIQVLAWDRQKNVAGLNQIMWSEHSSNDIWISNDSTCTNKRLKRDRREEGTLFYYLFLHKLHTNNDGRFDSINIPRNLLKTTEFKIIMSVQAFTLQQVLELGYSWKFDGSNDKHK